MPRLRFSTKTVPLAFFILTILTYGLMLPWTGFYWDDWPFAWIAKFLGPAEFIPAFEPFRPFLGPIFFGTTSLLPPNPLLWQSFALLLRLALGLSVWWTLKTIWPEARAIKYLWGDQYCDYKRLGKYGQPIYLLFS